MTGLRYKKHNNSTSLVADARDDEDAIINKEENFRCRASGSFQLKPEFSVLSQLFNWASLIYILSGFSRRLKSIYTPLVSVFIIALHWDRLRTNTNLLITFSLGVELKTRFRLIEIITWLLKFYIS